MVTRPATALAISDEDDASVAERAAFPGVPFIDAAPNQCRWPLWEAETDPQHVCGARKLPGSSYCREHQHRARAVGHNLSPAPNNERPR
jgi:hypothetical protein